MMAQFILCALLLLIRTENLLADTTNIHRMESPSTAKKISAANEEMKVSENMLSVFWKDLTLLQHALELIEDDTCKNMVELVLASHQNLTNWAMKFYDASGKFPEGILAGSVYQLGNFDECLNIGNEDEAPESVAGKYCLTELQVDVSEAYLKKNNSVWQNFRVPTERHQDSLNEIFWGVCVPTVCSPRDIEKIINRFLLMTISEPNLELVARVSENSCFTSAHKPIETAEIIYISVICSMVAAVAVGTIFHVIYFRSQTNVPSGMLSQTLIAFSIISNMKKLLSRAHENDLFLECISGIKFVSMLLIIAGHTLLFVISGPILNKSYWEEAITKVENSIFLNNPLLVDTFLLLSGFLFCRILLHELDNRKSVNFALLYILRYIRLTPAYLVIIGLYLTWLPRLDVGPLWSRMLAEKERCLTSWWTNILYINNYVHADKICMFQSWYLSVDTQLFILAPIVIYPLWKWRKIGEYVLIMCTIASVVVPFIITLINNLDPTLMFYTTEFKDILRNKYFINSYIKTHMRSEAYCFGLLCGYIVYRMHISDYRLSKKTVRLGWIFSSLSLIVSMCSITIFYGVRRNFSAVEAAFYASLHRALWSIGTSWVLIACITNNSGPLGDFLKWRPFVPLSRLTYCAYLVNGLIELHSVATIRSPRYLSNFSLLSLTLSHVVLTFGGATLLSILFESPILGLERIFLQNKKKESKTSNPVIDVPNEIHAEQT